MGRLAKGGELQIEPPDVALLEQLVLSLGSDPYERMALINLDAAGFVLSADIVCEGEDNKLEGRYRSIVSSALIQGAASLLVAHNHPSDSVLPSEADRLFTRKLGALLRTVDVTLADHIIVTRREAFSMRKVGLV